MDGKNVTMITVIHLLGLQTPQSITCLVFFGFLMIYCGIICGNLLIITLVLNHKALHSPMYFFLSHLSVLDILLVTVVLPNMLHTILVNEAIMLFSACITQFYFFGVPEISECLLLTVMSYDRYLAICKPLHYNLVMSNKFCWMMVITSWTLASLLLLNDTVKLSKLQFCGPNIIDHFFCDLDPILKLSCSDTTFFQWEVTLWSIFSVIIPFYIIILSYVYILNTIFKIPSVTGRQKAFSTCSSHLTIVSIFYGTLLGVYLVPTSGKSWNVKKYLAILYTVVTPLMNPIIYSLRNKDLKDAVGKLIGNFRKY
ncbi:olfactory receptor 1500-like [Gastrophryne carolinensis]